MEGPMKGEDFKKCLSDGYMSSLGCKSWLPKVAEGSH